LKHDEQMNTEQGLERCLAFLNAHARPTGAPHADAEAGRAVTISRQAGCGALVVGQSLADYLQAHFLKGTRPWTVFDRNLVEQVLEDHHLPKRLAKFMPEDRISEIADTIEDLFGLHPPSWVLVRKTAQTILHLAQLGHVILIGRGGNIITRKLPHVFHVRLVGSLEKRVEHVREFNHLDKEAALEFIRREDRGRVRYLKKHFHADIDDPLLYHLVINTDLVPYAKAARLIGDAMLNRDEAQLVAPIDRNSASRALANK
jgi:cytidylate kinase